MTTGAAQLEQQAVTADPRVAGTEDLLAQFRAIEKEAGEAPAEEPAAEPAKAEPEKPKEEAAEKPKKPEGKKTAAQYAADRIAAKNARIEAREAELATKEQELSRKLADADATSPAKLKALVESGRADDLAKTMGYESWEKLNDHFARLYASPEYKRIRELEAKDAAREKEIADARAAAEARQLQEREAQQWAAAQVEVGDTLKGNDDPVLAKFGEDEGFCAEVLRRVVAGKGEKDIDEVAQEVLDGIVERVRRWKEDLGDRLSEKAETAAAGTPNRPGSKQAAKPQKHVSRQSATEAANPLPKEMTDAEWKAFGTAELAKAMRADEEARLKERQG